MTSAEKQLEEFQLRAQKFSEEIARQARPIMEEFRRMTDSPHFQEAMRTAIKAANFISRMKMDQAREWSYLLQSEHPRSTLIEALQEVGVTDSTRAADVVVEDIADQTIEAIEEKVTSLSENKTEVIHLELTADGHLRNLDEPNKSHKLSVSMQMLVLALRHEFVPTPLLTRRSGYANDKSTRQAFQKLSRLSFGKLGLLVSLWIGEKDSGYRLSKCIRIKRRPPHRA